MSADYYILDARSCVGNCALWWAPDAKGYVCNLTDAGRYTLEYAISQRHTDIPVHRSIAERLVVQHVRWEHLFEAGVDIYGAQKGVRPDVLPPDTAE